MTAPVRMAVFAMTLVIVFLAARALGSVVGPVGEDPAVPPPAHQEQPS
ncbi:hypothetical protein [Nocardioides coralli]|nr:hypothetical protein [Nocardioides coralli]QZY29201.1 hypothetical protein K6T13_00245 [Nocardioides coralli]